MPQLLRPCVECGELSDRAHCPEHRPKTADHTKTAHQRGYDWTWQQLSARARRLQPFCEECGTTEDLTTDHTPEAWRRKQAGKTIRLRDVRVLCRSCNASAGAARGEHARTEP